MKDHSHWQKEDKRLHTKNSTAPVTAVENTLPALAEGEVE